MFHTDTLPSVNARVIDELKPIDMDQYVRELIDETEPIIVICGMRYSPAYALEQVDPVAFRCMVSDSFDSETMFEASDGEYYDMAEVEDIIDEEEAKV